MSLIFNLWEKNNIYAMSFGVEKEVWSSAFRRHFPRKHWGQTHNLIVSTTAPLSVYLFSGAGRAIIPVPPVPGRIPLLPRGSGAPKGAGGASPQCARRQVLRPMS